MTTHVYNDCISGGKCVLRVDNSGEVREGAYAGSCLGRIDRDGHVYEHAIVGEPVVGIVSNDGRVYRLSIFGGKGTCVGHTDSSKKIYQDVGGGPCVGRIDGGMIKEAAAAYLLLFLRLK